MNLAFMRSGSGDIKERAKRTKTEFGGIIYKGFPENKLSYSYKILNDKLRYEEDLNLFNWEILPKNKEIKGFNAQKATTSFAGRSYIAWFTSEIPISDGPYKFNGLPGLIIKIADEEEYYIFELIGFKSLKDPIFDTESGEEYLETDKSRFLEIKKEYNADPLAAMGRAGITFGFEPGQREKLYKKHREKLKKENNPLELE